MEWELPEPELSSSVGLVWCRVVQIFGSLLMFDARKKTEWHALNEMMWKQQKPELLRSIAAAWWSVSDECSVGIAGNCEAHVPQRGQSPEAHAQDSNIGTSALEVKKKKMELGIQMMILQPLASYWRLTNNPRVGNWKGYLVTKFSTDRSISQHLKRKHGRSVEMKYCNNHDKCPLQYTSIPVQDSRKHIQLSWSNSYAHDCLVLCTH